MSWYYQDAAVSLLLGDASEQLRALPAKSVACVVSSPPYYSLRDYGHDGQIGLEDTPDEYVARLVEVFREVHRVLCDDGTLWLNLGDSYYSGKGAAHGVDGANGHRRFGLRPLDRSGLGLPRKSLVGIPWRVALALQEDGWTLRSDIAWERPAAQPEPTAKDRPWRTFEHIFLLAKGPRYFFDRGALCGSEDVWRINPTPSRETQRHAAPFPLDLPRRCISAGCKPGGVVLDPFSGAGTTMLAARHLGHQAIGIDINAMYHDIALRRMANAVLSFEDGGVV